MLGRVGRPFKGFLGFEGNSIIFYWRNIIVLFIIVCMALNFRLLCIILATFDAVKNKLFFYWYFLQFRESLSLYENVHVKNISGQQC